MLSQSREKSPIIQSNRILDILTHGSYDSWFLLDLDNTLFESKQELGSDQWFSKLSAHACALIRDNAKAMELVLALYHAVQHFTQVKSIEPEIIRVIKTLQDIGLPVIALTARGKNIIEPTLKQLHSLDISFSVDMSFFRGSNADKKAKTRIKSKDDLYIKSKPSIKNKDNDLQKIKLATKSHGEPAYYYQGIIFCNGNDKGECLDAFFSLLSNTPQHVIMADDKEKSLHSVNKIMNNLNRNFTGIRYSYLDEKAAKIDMEKAKAQLQKMLPSLPPKAQDAASILKLAPKKVTWSAHNKVIPATTSLVNDAKSHMIRGRM